MFFFNQMYFCLSEDEGKALNNGQLNGGSKEEKNLLLYFYVQPISLSWLSLLQ